MNKELRKLRTKADSLHCKGTCQESCGPIVIEGKEEQKVKEYCNRNNIQFHELKPPTKTEFISLLMKDDSDLVCPYLKEGRCSIYSVRPMICKLWGVVESMKCMNGCVPEKGFLTDKEGISLMRASI